MNLKFVDVIIKVNYRLTTLLDVLIGLKYYVYTQLQTFHITVCEMRESKWEAMFPWQHDMKRIMKKCRTKFDL